MYSFTFNNKSSSEFPAFVVNRPNIPTASENIKKYTIPGRSGALIVKEGTYPDITISIDMTYVSDANDFAKVFRELKAWLLASVDNKLSFSDDADFFYLVKNVTLSDNKRTKRYIGKFTVIFTCEAFQYAVAGSEFMDIANVATNPYALCHPIYQVVGNGVCNLTVNGKVFTVTVAQSALIDSEKMVTLGANGTLQNTTSSGDYEDLYLVTGENTITTTDGFTVTVKPRWRTI